MGFCEFSGGVVAPWPGTGKWKPHGALSRINLDCATGRTAAYYTTRVFEHWSIFNAASAVHDAPAHVPQSLPSPLLPTASVKPYFLRSSDPSANFFARLSARTFSFLLDFDLRETFFRRSPSRVLFFGRLQYRPFLDNFNTVWPSGDPYHNLHIFSSGFFLLGPYSPLQIYFVMKAYCFLFQFSIFLCINLILEWTMTHSFMFLCSIFFCMCSFDKFSSSLVDSSLQHALDPFRVLCPCQLFEGTGVKFSFFILHLQKIWGLQPWLLGSNVHHMYLIHFYCVEYGDT